MGKYTSYKPEKPQKSKEPHEIWRGLGCLMMIIIPAISIAAGSLTVDYISGVKPNFFPRSLMGNPRLPDLVYESKNLTKLLEPVTDIKDLYAIALVSILYMIVIGGVIAVIYAAVYSAVGPSRYGPTDVPPLKPKKVVKKSR